DQHHGPSTTGTVVLDIGASTGCLVPLPGPAELGREIEIGTAGSPRTHVAVRARHVNGRTLYGAVYPALPAGEYTVWRDATTPAGTVTIRGAHITEFTWPEDR